MKHLHFVQINYHFECTDTRNQFKVTSFVSSATCLLLHGTKRDLKYRKRNCMYYLFFGCQTYWMYLFVYQITHKNGKKSRTYDVQKSIDWYLKSSNLHWNWWKWKQMEEIKKQRNIRTFNKSGWWHFLCFFCLFFFMFFFRHFWTDQIDCMKS